MDVDIESLTPASFMELLSQAESGNLLPLSQHLDAVSLETLKIGGVSALQATVSVGSATGTRAILASAGKARDMLINAHDSQGFAPLHLAVEVGSPDCLAALVEGRADVELQTADAVYQLGQLTKLYSEGHRTALHLAVEKIDKDATAVLLSAGASPLALNSFSKRPLDLALEQLTLSTTSARREVCIQLATLLGATAEQLGDASTADAANVSEERRKRASKLRDRIQLAVQKQADIDAADMGKMVSRHYKARDSALISGSGLRKGSDFASWLFQSSPVTRSDTGFKEPTAGVFVGPFLSPELCSRMWKEIMHYEEQATQLNGLLPLPFRHDGSLELSRIFPGLLQAIADAAQPAIRAFLPTHLREARLQHAFRTKNVMGREDRDGSFVRHVDKYAVTFNICLHKTADVEGSGVFFYADEETQEVAYRHEHAVGVAVLHSSKEWHMTESLRRGERGSLIMWFDIPHA